MQLLVGIDTCLAQLEAAQERLEVAMEQQGAVIEQLWDSVQALIGQI